MEGQSIVERDRRIEERSNFCVDCMHFYKLLQTSRQEWLVHKENKGREQASRERVSTSVSE